MHSSAFTVAGMPLNTSTSSSHAQHSTSTPNLHAWGSSSSLNMSPGATTTGHGTLGAGIGASGIGATAPGMTTSFSDSHSLTQSRGHYQAGYLMSSQNNGSPPGGQHPPDEPPIVQTKAKMNKMLSRGSTTEFGMDSMFESTRRQRQKLADEDAPPTASVFDLPNDVPFEKSSIPSHFQLRNSILDSTLRSTQHAASPAGSGTHHRQSLQPPQQPVYVIVFGYPIDKYSLAVEYFQSLGSQVTQPEMCDDVQNCFKIGYYDPVEAIRAVRRNGEVLAGSWMVGVKYADPTLGDSGGGSALTASAGSMEIDNDSTPPRPSSAQVQAQTPTVGTPIRLAPSSSAFRRNAPGTPRQGQSGDKQQKPGPIRSWGPAAPGAAAGAQDEAKKGMFGQVSDLIFGW